MKRLQIMIEEDLDAALDVQARREGVSKAALVRRYVGERLRPLSASDDDSLTELVGIIQGGPRSDAAMIDDVVYGPER